MLRVTADIFSGRPDPSWIVTDEVEARSILRDLQKDGQLLTDTTSADGGLGFRGLRVEGLTDDLGADLEMRDSLYVPVGTGRGDGRTSELAERLLATMARAEPDPSAADADSALALDETFHAYLKSQFEQASRASRMDTLDQPDHQKQASEDARLAAATCMIEFGAFNPGFWNNDPTVRSTNNCYNYASNKRTNTFAQPGRGSGHMYTAITCPAVTTASLSDGLHRRFDCFPDSEKPRYLVAMVVAPGPGFVDFHWYRKQKEGFWGHKPGGTAARNTDNSGHVITNPETCNRGPYTQFCGYFYTCKSQRIR